MKKTTFSNGFFSYESYRTRITQRLSDYGTFYDAIKEILQQQDMYEKDNKKLIAATHLSGTICSRLKNDKNYNPDIKTIIAFCIGTKTSEEKTYRLLMLKKHTLSPEDPVHNAYIDLLKAYAFYDWGIQECNEILNQWGIDKKYFLGSFDRDEVI